MKQFWQAVHLLAILLYLLVGGILMFGNMFTGEIADAYRRPLGGIMMLYGIFRIVRYYSKSKTEGHD